MVRLFLGILETSSALQITGVNISLERITNKCATYRTVVKWGPANCDGGEAGRLGAGGLHVARYRVGCRRAVHIDGGSWRIGRWERSTCIRRMRRSRGAEALRCCGSGLVVVHHCKWNREVALVWWCVCSRGGGPARGRRPLSSGHTSNGHTTNHAHQAPRPILPTRRLSTRLMVAVLPLPLQLSPLSHALYRPTFYYSSTTWFIMDGCLEAGIREIKLCFFDLSLAQNWNTVFVFEISCNGTLKSICIKFV